MQIQLKIMPLDQKWAVVALPATVLSFHETQNEAQAKLESIQTETRSLHGGHAAGWFLGPGSENSDFFLNRIQHVLNDYLHFRQNYFPSDPTPVRKSTLRQQEHWMDHFSTELDGLLKDLKAHFPTFSPRYLAHMISEQSIPSILGYIAGLLYNPNNVTSEAAPVTVDLELEVGRMLASMLGYNPEQSWAHLCAGGTIANIEALWVARNARYNPLCIQEYCEKQGLEFFLSIPGKTSTDIRRLNPRELLMLPPDLALTLPKRFFAEIESIQGEAKRRLQDFMAESSYSIAHRGISAVLHKVGLKPEILVSEAAHYSFEKAVDLLGLGRDSIKSIALNPDFRLNPSALRHYLMKESSSTDSFPLAIAAILGTTELGAVDPLHEVLKIREEIFYRTGQSFWIHADAAWGGYIRTLFANQSWGQSPDPKLEMPFYLPAKDGFTTQEAKWQDPSVLKAFEATSQADSITLDPHKLGYIPYPAGAIAFQKREAREFLAVHPPYITGHKAPEGIGPFILEGSKPGAAAASCYLAHKTIPLNPSGHGQLIRNNLLYTQKLYQALNHPIHPEIADQDFQFLPLNRPDTNLLGYILHPRQNSPMGPIPKPIALSKLNLLNEALYHRLSIPASDFPHRFSYLQEYFVSKTRLKVCHLREFLEKWQIEVDLPEDSATLFTLRSTLMNPFYKLAEKEGKDYILEFVDHLHTLARELIQSK